LHGWLAKVGSENEVGVFEGVAGEDCDDHRIAIDSA
jgi:hypothetical protein